MFDGKSFGTYLRYQRELRGVSLDHVSHVTKISRSLLESLEHDDVSKWPPGIFCRGFFRAYASTVGFDPNPLMDDFARMFARPPEKGRSRAATTEFSRPYSTSLRMTLASDDLAATIKREDVVPALLDGLLMVLLALAAVRVGSGHIAVGVALSALYYVVPRALGWQTVGTMIVRLVTTARTPARRARIRESADALRMPTSGVLEPRLVIRSVNQDEQSRLAG